MFNEPHEDAEIAIVVKRIKTVKEIKGNMRNSQIAERVEVSENVDSQVGKVGDSEFNFLKFLRATDLMFECGHLLDMSKSILKDRGVTGSCLEICGARKLLGASLSELLKAKVEKGFM